MNDINFYINFSQSVYHISDFSPPIVGALEMYKPYRNPLELLLLKAEVAARKQPLRPRTLKKSEAKAKNLVAEDRLPRGRGQKGSRPRPRLDYTFENTRKYKRKHCNYDFTGIQS